MNSHEIDISIQNAFCQASLTAKHYLYEAIEILDGTDHEWEIKDAIALSHIMAIDFEGCILNMKLQEIRDAISERNEK